MAGKLSTQALAKVSGRHPWIVVGIWVIVLFLTGSYASNFLNDALSTQESFTNEAESKRANTLLKKYLPGSDKVNEFVIVKSDTLKVDDPAFRDAVNKLRSDITGLGSNVVEGAMDFYVTGDKSLVSSDRQTTILPVAMAGAPAKANNNIDRVHEVIERAEKDSRFKIMITGSATMDKEIKEAAEKDLQKGELYGVLAALIVLVLVSGTIVSAVVPLLIAIAAIIPAMGATALLGRSMDLSFFIVNMITMMGLAVGIDYSLFVVSRYREELARGASVTDAVAATGATANRAVFFSGMTVILSLLGLLIVPHSMFRSIAIGAILAVISALLASLTLLPAALRLLGAKVNALPVPFLGRSSADRDGTEKNGFWGPAAKTIMRRPVVSLILGIGLLLAAAFPYFNINIGTSRGAGMLPDGLQSKQAFLILKDEFSFGKVSPSQVVVRGQLNSKPVLKAVERLKTALQSDPVFAPSVLNVDPSQSLGLLTVPVFAESDSAKAIRAVKKMRRVYIPKAFSNVEAKTLVTGETADVVDFLRLVKDYTPLVFAFVLGLSFILLTVVFRSLVVPAKAILMNLLSVGAAYGLIVLVFQKGFGAAWLGLQQVNTVEAFIPLFLFSILFGLSMDYHVFLLSRIREHFDKTGDNGKSVAFGLQSTGRIITGAALIMVAVFAGFASSRLVVLQQVGFGLAVAVFLDATIVRSILVPAGMKLLGARNWYLPKALDWLPTVSVEDSPVEDSRLIKREVACEQE